MNQELFERCMFWISFAGLDWRKRNKLAIFRITFGIIFTIFQSFFALILLLHWQGIDTLEAVSESIPTLIQVCEFYCFQIALRCKLFFRLYLKLLH